MASAPDRISALFADKIIGQPSDAVFKLVSKRLDVSAFIDALVVIAMSDAPVEAQLLNVRKLYRDNFKHSNMDAVDRDADMALFAILASWSASASFPRIDAGAACPDRPEWKQVEVAGPSIRGTSTAPLFLYQ
jgi:hypothetical protein